MLILLLTTVGFALLACLMAAWTYRQNRWLRNALCELAEKTGEPLPEVRRRWLPRFGLKSMLVVTTLMAVVLGMFAREMLRAQQQDRLIAALEESGSGDIGFSVAAEYEMGLLGEGELADWFAIKCHPSFGSRASRIALIDRGHGHFAGRLDKLLEPTSAHAQIGKLRGLKELQITGLRLTDEVVENIGTLGKLRRLSLLGCELPPKSLDRWADSLDLDFLELRNCGIRDVDLDGLERMVSLETLILFDNPITDAGMVTMTTLANLRELDLSRTKIKGDGLDCLAELDKLERFAARDVDLEAAHLAAIHHLPQLRKVFLFAPIAEAKQGDMIELFRSRPEIEVVWKSDDVDPEWSLWDNRPGRYEMPGASSISTGSHIPP